MLIRDNRVRIAWGKPLEGMPYNIIKCYIILHEKREKMANFRAVSLIPEGAKVPH